MYNTKIQEDKIIKMCTEKEKKPKKKGDAVFVGKCGKKKSKCMCKKNGNTK